MARKKIIFVIVEGVSDEEALGVILNRIYDKNTVYVHIMRKDITTEFNNVPNKNIFTMVGDEIRGYANSNHFKKADFKEIIHIVDMDGAFIPDASIVENKNAIKPQYTLSEIYTCNKRGIEDRNKRKSKNINSLYTRSKIWGVPYRLFYMSCNLDHVLYDRQNSSDDEKATNSFKFAKFYKDKIPAFIDFICNSAFSVMSGYEESWNFIKQDLHSLERHSNLGLCFEGFKSEKSSDIDDTDNHG